MTFSEKLTSRLQSSNSLLCVGLDSDLARLPERFQELEQPQFEFNTWVIDQTHASVVAYKPNLAFYEARGAAGWKELALTLQYLHSKHPDIVTIADAKRADIGNTNNGYVTAIFDELGFDAITLHPYLGKEALQPFLDRTDKGCIILCKTSNPGSGELQDLELSSGLKVYEQVATTVVENWDENNNCLLVVGATYPEEMKKIRQIAPNLFFLVPGIGAQGGDVAATVAAGQNDTGDGLILNSGRGIIFALDPATEAYKLQQEINRYRTV